jgi:hypothetical protein
MHIASLDFPPTFRFFSTTPNVSNHNFLFLSKNNNEDQRSPILQASKNRPLSFPTMPTATYVVKGVVSCSLLIFSLITIHALIFDEQTALSSDVHPALAVIAFWGGLIWLSMVEGGQASMVGLPPVDRSLYKESHPISHSICEWGHKVRPRSPSELSTTANDRNYASISFESMFRPIQRNRHTMKDRIATR